MPKAVHSGQYGMHYLTKMEHFVFVLVQTRWKGSTWQKKKKRRKYGLATNEAGCEIFT